jgi:GntR family transcriptional regulator/MocR family aminotransferase
MPLSGLDDGDEAGELELRTAIAAHVDASRGIQCSPSQVIIVSSAQSAIHLAALVLAARGEVWVEDPGYFGTLSAIRSAGAEPIAVPVDENGLMVEEGISRAPQAKLAVVTPASQFPLGVTMPLERRHALTQWAAGAGAWIVEDDYDSEFPIAKRVLRPLAALSAASRVIYINTFSKTLFPALRLAYLIVPETLVGRFIAARRGIERNATVPNQMVLTDFLSTGQFARHLRRCREAYAERRAVMLEGIAREFAGALRTHEHRSGLHICATYDAEVDDGDLASRAAKAGVVVEPLHRFFSGSQSQRGLLLGYAGFTPAVIRAQLSTLARAIGPALRQR